MATYTSALRHARKWLCSKCWNKLPATVTGGRGARDIGWLPPNEVEERKVQCSECKCECYKHGEPPENERG